VDNQTILLAFVVVTGLAVLLQTIILLAIFVAVRKAAGSIRDEIEKLYTSLMPIVYDARNVLANTQEFLADAQGFLTRVTPKIESAAGDLAEVTRGLREQTEEFEFAAMEIVEQVRSQSNRLDGMITGLLDSVDRAGGFVTTLVSKPARQISLILGVVKAVVESLRTPPTLRRSANPAADEERSV
jgi:hypothetical protein